MKKLLTFGIGIFALLIANAHSNENKRVIEVFSASPSIPISVSFLDINGHEVSNQSKLDLHPFARNGEYFVQTKVPSEAHFVYFYNDRSRSEPYELNLEPSETRVFVVLAQKKHTLGLWMEIQGTNIIGGYKFKVKDFLVSKAAPGVRGWSLAGTLDKDLFEVSRKIKWTEKSINFNFEVPLQYGIQMQPGDTLKVLYPVRIRSHYATPRAEEYRESIISTLRVNQEIMYLDHAILVNGEVWVYHEVVR